MSRRVPQGVGILALGLLAQFLLEASLPSGLVPNVMLLALIYLHHRRGYRWRVDGAFWSGLLLGLMLKQQPGAYALAAMASVSIAASVRGSLARRSSLSTLMEVLVAGLIFDLIIVLLLGRPVLVCLPAYVAPLLKRGVLTALAYLVLALAGSLGRVITGRAASH